LDNRRKQQMAKGKKAGSISGGSGKTVDSRKKQPPARPVGKYEATMTGKAGKMPNCPNKI